MSVLITGILGHKCRYSSDHQILSVRLRSSRSLLNEVFDLKLTSGTGALSRLRIQWCPVVPSKARGGDVWRASDFGMEKWYDISRYMLLSYMLKKKRKTDLIQRISGFSF